MVERPNDLQLRLVVDRQGKATDGLSTDNTGSSDIRSGAQEGRNVLSLHGSPSLPPRSFERLRGEDLDVEPLGKGVDDRIRRVIDVSLEKPSYDQVDDLWIDERTVGGQAHDDICLRCGRREVEAVQN